MKTVITAYITTGVAFLVVDAIWLTTMADMLYRPLLGDRLAPQFHLAPAVFFYLIYIAGIVFFAVLPSIESGSIGRAVLNGAVLGLVAYATYDLTNQATLKGWPWHVTLLDLCWGMFATAVAAGSGCWFASRHGGR